MIKWPITFWRECVVRAYAQSHPDRAAWCFIGHIGALAGWEMTYTGFDGRTVFELCVRRALA